MHRRWSLAVLALLAAGLVAELGVLLFWPPDGQVVGPDPVRAAEFFTPAQIARAADYRGPQFALYLVGTALQLLALTLVLLRPPRLLRRLTGADQAGEGARRPLLRAALTGAALSVLLRLVGLPLAAIGRQRGIDVGLVTRSWPGWVQDVALGAAIQAALMALTAVALVALMRRFPRSWWLPASAVVVAGAAVLLFITPVLLDPLFNRFTPLRGAARAEVLRLADRADVKVGEVYVIDASRRTTAANAYVAGFGTTKRVVVYDTLLERFPPAELRFVLAHELAHQHYDDVRNGLLYVLLVAPVGLLAVALLTSAMSRGAGPLRPGPGVRADARTLPALALALLLVLPVITSVSNQLSRRVEARADTFALQLTDAPQALVDFRTRSAVQNLAEPDPGALSQSLLGTHPTTLDRIGVARAWQRGERP